MRGFCSLAGVVLERCALSNRKLRRVGVFGRGWGVGRLDWQGVHFSISVASAGMLTNWHSFWERLERGESVAAEELFARYSEQLIQLASRNIHPALVKRFDGEDVVQSVFRTFFRRHGAGQLRIEHSQQLWKLLVTITLCKTRSMARRHTAERRDVKLDQQIVSDADLADRQPNPSDALALWEEIDLALKGLPPKTGEILSARLEGKSKSEIASELNLSRQTIHRILNLVEERLSSRIEELSAADA